MSFLKRSASADFALIAIAVVLIAAVVGWRSLKSDTTKVAGMVHGFSEPSVPPIASNGSTRGLSERGQIRSDSFQRKAFEGMDTALKMERVRGSGDGQSLYISSGLNSICAGNSRVSARVELEKFCSGYRSSNETLETQLDKLPPGDGFAKVHGAASDLYEALNKEGNAEVVGDLATELSESMLSASSGLEAVSAADALLQSGIVSQAVAQYAVDESIRMSRDDLIKAQTLAAKINACSSFGGCAAGEGLGAIFCASETPCTGGSSIADIWKRNYSPSVFEAAQRIEKGVFKSRPRSG